MATPKRTPENIALALKAFHEHGENYRAAADALGWDRMTLKRHVLEGQKENSDEDTLRQECEANGVALDDVAYYWLKTQSVSMMVKRSGARSYAEMRDEIIAEMDAHSPVYLPQTHIPGEHLLVVDPADVHIGKLSRVLETGYDYDIGEASRRARSGVSGLLAKAQPFGVKKILFVIGNDILHIDHPHRTTTSGTPQDTSGQWWEMYNEAKRCYIAIIEQLTTVADVHVVFCPSNHDYVSGWMLADTLYSWFRLNPNVHFGEDQRNISISHRKYVRFGANLIGLTHGDGAKEKDLPSLMQYEARADWGQILYAYWYTHHIHHKDRKVMGATPQKREKDHIGVTVLQASTAVDPSKNIYIESVRSPSPADGWHDRNGYDNTQAVEAFLHHPDLGQVARFTHPF